MSYNLSLLPSEQKNEIELDKQASFLVWQVKQGKITPETLVIELDKKTQAHEHAVFEQSIKKYQQMMGL
ncbi:MAG: DUF3283 family protein [Vibrio sp.]